MSRSREDLSRRSKALSTNNRGFVSSRKRFDDARENLNDEDEEDVRLETYRRTKKVDAMRSIARHESRGLKSQEILEESPNGYIISGNAPPEMPRAIKYYSYQLRQYTVTDYPVEYGICHYSLGKIFFADKHHSTRDYEARAKSIENGLHHFRLAVEVFDYDSYPIMYAIINIFIGQLFRERAMLITARSILAKRGVTVADSCTIGLSQLMDAAMTFSNAGSHVVENAICHVEIGWLYLLQLTEAIAEEGLVDPGTRRKGRPKEVATEETLMTLREHAITSLEKAEGLLESLKGEPVQTRYGPKKMARGWDPLDRESYPAYINLLIMDLSLEYIYGLISYLTGRIYQDWDPGLEHQSQAYEFYRNSVKQHGLPVNCNEYIDAHHRIAQVLVQNPAIYDDNQALHEDGMPTSDLCYVVAGEHLHLALQSSVIKPGRKMDIAFHLAQANIARFHIIVDRVKPGESVVQALVQKDGIDIMKDIERALREAMKGATAANTQSTQDAFVYYYSSIKLSEFRTLQSGMDPALPAASRLKLLTQAFNLLVDALLSRSIVDNLDLHYIATVTMAQGLMSSRCYDPCTMWYTKALMCLSSACNRTQHTPKNIKHVCFRKVEKEMQMQVEKSILASSRELRWEKEHLGALYLTESVTSGYAYWSFEEEFNKPPKPPPEPPKKALTAAEAMEGRHPPERLQPHMSDSEREYANRQRLTGDAMRDSDMSHAPIGAVPLWAMDHHPEFDKLDEILKAGKFGHRDNNQFSERQRATVPGDIIQTLMMHVHIVKSQEHVKKSVSLMPKVSLGKKAKQLQPRVERPQLTKIGETKKVRKQGLYGFLTGEMEEVPADMAPGQVNSTDEEAIEAIPKIDLMASRQCFCFFMTLSRLSRSALVLRANSVRFNYGRRVRDILSSLQEDTGRAYFDINKQLGKASQHLVVPPTSIRELSRRSFEDLRGVFRSNVEICRLLADYEEFLYTKLARFDYHIPMMCAMPSFTRDICGSDAMLLNPDVMLDTMVEEARRQAQEEADAEAGDGVDAGVYIRDKKSPQKDTWRLSSPTKSKKPQLDDAAKARVAAAKKKAKKDALDHMAYQLFQKLDGSGFLGGSKHMLSEKLHPNEVMFLWHYPSMDDQRVHLIMAWREESHNYVYRARRREAYKRLKKEGRIDPDTGLNFVHLKDVVMEVCRSEVTRAQVDTLIRNYLKALNQNSAARRITHSTKALRALSSYLGIGETLLMLPSHIDSIVVCCPTFMRAIPWHALLIELHTEEFGKGASSTAELVAKGKLPKSVSAFQREANILETGKEAHVPGVEEYHLVEKYMVRMGPSLALFEVCLVLSDELGSAHGTHRMCAIDGEARNLRSPGLRATDNEIACVTSTFSGDPDDVTLLQYDLASARQVDTGKATHVSKAELKRRNQMREMKAKKRDEKLAEYEKDDNLGVDDMDEESDSDMSSDDEEAIANRNALGMARVLHFAANRMPMQIEVDGNPAAMAAKGHHGVNFGEYAAVCLPQYVNRHGDFTQDKRRELSAGDLVAQVNLRNCALAVMSRFGVCDGALAGSDVLEANVEYLESVHMIGAATVLYPMQNTGDQGGLNTLASTLFLIKFYVELPAFSRERLSVCKAHRKAMLWLREQTATELISWLDSIPIPSQQREDLILEIEKYVDAATSGQDYGDTEDLPTVHEDEERERPADRKFFAHFLLWGNFTVSGAGGNVHPKNLTEEGEDVEKDHLMYDNALNDIRMEIFMLKEEGRFAEAKQLEKRLTELQVAAVQEKVDKAKYYGTLASRGISDVLDALDKALLDQDEDEIDLENEAPPPDAELRKQKEDKSYFVPKQRKEPSIDLWERGDVPTTAPRYVPLPESLQKVGLDKLAETPTPISMMTAYVESLFPHGNKEAEENFNKSKVKKLRVIKKQEEVEKREIAMKMAERPDEYEGEIREKERQEKLKQRKRDYEPMYEEIEAKKKEKQRLHKINHSADNAIDHLKSESDSSACAIS